MSDNETTLIQKAQKGNHEAFAALVDEHQRYVYNLALRVVKDENEALDGLDANYKLLITLRYQNELSYDEIASTLNLPLGTVKTGIFRAKAQLRKALVQLEDSWITA